MRLHPASSVEADSGTASFDVPAVFTDLLAGLASMASSLPAPFTVTAAILGLFAVLGTLSRRGSGPKDPTRLFSSNQRREGFDRAGGQCELESVPFRRCRRPAHHGDHWFPWSKGGSTSMANFVAACVQCNLSKGSRVPGYWQTMRLESRRRKYFAAGITTKAGERFSQR